MYLLIKMKKYMNSFIIALLKTTGLLIIGFALMGFLAIIGLLCYIASKFGEVIINKIDRYFEEREKR
jgi:hypothetical protein